MSALKERIFGAITVMSEDDAAIIWKMIEMRFSHPLDIPTDDEVSVIKAYTQGDAQYKPYINHEDLKKELGLE